MEFAFPYRENRWTDSELMTPVSALKPRRQEFYYAQTDLGQLTDYI
jgi:hypothetical protein